MTVNYLMVSNYHMASSDDGYLMASSDDGQLPHGF